MASMAQMDGSMALDALIVCRELRAVLPTGRVLCKLCALSS